MYDTRHLQHTNCTLRSSIKTHAFEPSPHAKLRGVASPATCLVLSLHIPHNRHAIPQVFEGQEDPGQEGQAEPPHPPLDSPAHR